MSNKLADLREQFPQYADVDDERLGEAIRERYYPDMEPVEFRRRVGLPVDTPPEEPSTSDKLDAALRSPEQRRRGRGGDLLGDLDELAGDDEDGRDAIDEALDRSLGRDVEDDPGFLSNAVRLAADRGTRLLGSAIKGIVGRPGEALQERFGGGEIVYGTDWGEDDPADGKFRVRYMSGDELAELEAEKEIRNVVDTAAEHWTSRDFGGEKRNTPEEIKRAYASGDVSDTLGATLKFGMESGIESIPDMVAVMAGPLGLAGYVGARSSEIGEERARNKGLPDAGLQEQLEALPAALGSALLERVGVRGMTGIGRRQAEQIANRGVRAGLRRAGGAMTRGAATEGATEAFQEGVIEYFGETLGTDVATDMGHMLERGFFGMLAGATYGGAAGGATGAGRELVGAIDQTVMNRLGDDAVLDRVNRRMGRGRAQRGEGRGDTADRERGHVEQPGEVVDDDLEPTDVPRGDPADPETDVAGTPDPVAEPFDPRLKREPHRVRVAQMADELDTSASVQPSWFNVMGAADLKTSIAGVRAAVEKALNNQPLGVREARVVQHMLDTVTAERTAPENMAYVRAELDRARAQRREARRTAGLDTGPEFAPPEAYAGELLEEEGYSADMDGETRALWEMTVVAEEAGFSDAVDRILAGAETNQQAANELEALLRDQAIETGPPTAEAGPIDREAAPAAAAADRRQQAAEAEAEVDAGEAYASFLDRALRRFAMEEQGQAVLDDLEAGGISPRDVGARFWRETYSQLNAETQARFRRQVQGLTGMQPGDAIAQRPDGTVKRADDWLALADFLNEDLPGEVEHLEGTERGYVALMQWANEQAASAPEPAAEPTPARIEGPAEERRAGTERRDQARRAAFAELPLDEQIAIAYADDLVPELGNRRAFEETMAEAEAAPEAARPHVASIDVDSLKAVNDTLGHDAGDALLKTVGGSIARHGAEGFHISGDEFYVVADTRENLDRTMQSIQSDLEHQVLEVERGKLRGVGITYGVGQTKATADQAMETAKGERERAGRRSPRGVAPDGLVLNSLRVDMGAGTNYVGLIGKHGDLPLNANHEYVLGDGRVVRIPQETVRRRHVVKLLERHLGTRIYQGRVKGKTRLGFYRPGLGEIRIKATNDLEVTAHELAHWIDDRYPWVGELYRQHAHEVDQVSYDASKTHEGYAEFMRLWLTQDHMARQNAPGFYDAWMGELSQHGQLAETLAEVQELMHAWHLQGARKRLASKIGKDKLSLMQRFREEHTRISDKILQRVFDGLRQFKVVEREIRGELADATASGYLALRLARGAHGVMQGVYHRGTINWDANGDLEFTGKGIKHVFKPVDGRMDEMQQYMIARRAAELMEQGRENLIRPDEIAAGLALADPAQGGDPVLAEVFDEWQGFNRRMLDFAESSGILSDQARAAIEEMNQNYVPFNRVVDTFNGETVKRGGAPFMRLKGGTANVSDVFESIVANNTYLVQMALINHGKRNFYRMIDAEAGPLGSGAATEQTAALYATPIAKDVHPVTVDRDQVIKAAVESMGLTMRWYRQAKTGMVADETEATVVAMIDQMAEGMGDMLTFFKPNQDPTGNVDFYYEAGKKKFYEIADPLLYEAIQQLGPRPHNLAVSMLGGFANVLRRGVTLTPTFQAKNFIRDTMNAFQLSRGQIIPAASATKALLERMYNDEHYWLYMVNSGGFASMAQAEGINRDKIITDVQSAGQVYDRALSTAEYANRLAEFKALVDKGYSKRQAAYLGREISTDFAMRGSSDTLRVFTIAIPFLNARFQGLYRLAREVGQMEGGRGKFLGAQAFSFGLRATLSLMLPSLWLYFQNKDDPRYQEMPEWVRDLSWIVFTGDGEDDYVVIPKPFEVGMLFGTLPERMVEYLYSGDEKELADAMGWMITETFNFDFMLQAFKPLDDLRRNEKFTGAPIIPEYLEDVEAPEQYRFYTSDAMIALGRKLGVSPIKAEYLVRGYFGTLGTWALGAADFLVGDLSSGGVEPARRWQDNVLLAPFVNGGPLRRTKSEEDFYDMLRQTRQAATTLSLIERRSPERVEDYVSDTEKQIYAELNTELNQIASQLSELNNAMDQIRSDPDLDADEKRRQIEALQREKNALARDVRQNLDRNVIDEMVQDAEQAQAAGGQQ